MFKRRFTLIKNFSIPARLHTAGILALTGLLVTGGAGYIGLTQGNDGLTASITATSAVLNQKQADMLHDALRADVLYALQTGPDGSEQLRGEIQTDVAAHIDNFSSSIANLMALDLDETVRAQVVQVLPLLQAYSEAAQQITTLALSDKAAGFAKWDAFKASFSALEREMGTLGEHIEAKVRSPALGPMTATCNCSTSFWARWAPAPSSWSSRISCWPAASPSRSNASNKPSKRW